MCSEFTRERPCVQGNRRFGSHSGLSLERIVKMSENGYYKLESLKRVSYHLEVSLRPYCSLVIWVCVLGLSPTVQAENSGKNLAALNSGSMADVIMLAVDKETLRAELRTWPERHQDSSVLKTFRIAIGKQSGDKEREGDNRTPEGIYITQKIIEDSELPAKYGPKAIPINFPNPVDIYSRKSGSGIWLHGVEDDRRIEEANVTEGCVAFYNQDIRNLAQWLRPHQGIVVIAQDLGTVNQPADISAVRDATEGWQKAWAERNVDSYISYYGDQFSHKGMNRVAYQDYKKRIFNSYKAITLKLDQVRVVTHPKYAVTTMNQDFNGDNRFISNGRKVLYWMRDSSGQWKIVQEIFDDERFELTKFTAEQLSQLVKADQDPSKSSAAAVSGASSNF